jgi:hypothetical protein
MPGLLETVVQPKNKSPWGPIFIESFWEGLYTNRAALHSSGSLYENKYLGGRQGSLIGGLNTEISVRNTLIRRPGLSSFSTFNYPTPPNRGFSFPLTDGTIRVIIDTGSTGVLTLTSVATSSGGVAVYTGTITGGGSNAYIGLIFAVSGFTNPSNNGTFTCTASGTGTITLSNPIAVSETHAASTISTGAVYWDQQNGSATMLFSKAPLAGQTAFVASGGILYMGDGVDTKKYTPLNLNVPPGSSVSVWNWGIVAPKNQPNVAIVSSGASSPAWAATTMFSTMGLMYDAANNAMYQLNSVNASTTNTTQFGTSGSGQPAWAGVGGTTTDGSITWTNIGPIALWTANTIYSNAAVGGTATSPCAVFDTVTNAVYININPGFASGKSGPTRPLFKPGIGLDTQDGGVKWQNVGIPGTWQKSHLYPQIGHGPIPNNNNVSLVVEPSGLANGFPTNQTIFLQASGGGTSAASATSPFNATTNSFGAQTTDGDLIWLSLGTDQWVATTQVSQWRTNGTPFSAILDANGNFQVCSQTGITATVSPQTSYSITTVNNASGGTTTYNYAATTAMPVGSATAPVFAVFSGFAHAANNGTFLIISSTATSVTVQNAAGVSDTTGTAVYNPWPIGYGRTINDGTAIWTCVGDATTWVALTKWYLPATGFAVPSSSQPFGSASVIDSNTDVEFVINTGLSGAAHPTWAGIGGNTADNGTSFTLSQVTVNANGTTTYTGTTLSALAGQTVLVSGFTNAGNNALVDVLSANATTFTVVTHGQVNETHAGVAQNGLIWYNLSAFNSNSIAFAKGYAYAYSYKARAFNDFYSPLPLGGGNTPPGITVSPNGFTAFGPPTGSATNAISTASPAFIITGSNTGAVMTVTGTYSTDPQVDTIVIWRSADGGGASQMFELTEIPNVYVPGTVPGTWKFQDFLPDAATSQFPGLNTLIPAPINSSNNPPFSFFLPMAYNFERIWGAEGNAVGFSGGPDTLTGNPDEAFAPADSLPFLAPVIRAVKTTQGLMTFTTSSIEMILGGPLTSSFFSVTIGPGIGLAGFNALDIFAGEVFFLDTVSELRVVSPTLSVTTAGFPIADQLLFFNSKVAYVTFADLPNDSAIYTGTGSTAYNGHTGWFRMNPRQIPGSINGPEPVWSPFAAVTNGCQMVQALEISPGVKKLLVGPATGGNNILKRDFSVFTDAGTPYAANAQLGSLFLAHRGELALLRFIEADFALVTTNPTMSYLLNEISGVFSNFTTANAVFDPPDLYGTTLSPASYNPLRFYFLSQGSLARCVHMQIGINFGTTSAADEIFNLTVEGAIIKQR